MFSKQSFRTAAPQHSTILWMSAGAVLAIGAAITLLNGTSSLTIQAAHSIEFSALTALLFAPVAEELFFRGVVQESLQRRGISAGKAITLTALFFAAAHLHNSSLGHALATALPALFVGYVFHKTRRFGLFTALTSAIVLHSLFNAAWHAGIAQYFSNNLPWLA
jgi:membrane protease YdiL (CAAX protease family)